jgi:glycerate-2-kinase
MTRIQNSETLKSHGNVQGRKAMVEILEAGLQAADPYNNARKTMRIEGNCLIISGDEFVPEGAPIKGDEIIDLSEVGRIFVFGAGKGSQRIARAIEEVLGSRLTGGHIIDKKGGADILERIEVTFGAHPVPDEDCVRGCQRILEMTGDLCDKDLVFTVVCNGVSSLLTLPVPGVSLEDIRKTTYLMQIEKGVPTSDLNPVRNHLDMMKGGRLTRFIQPAKAIHFIGWQPQKYEFLMNKNLWLHTLPEATTFADAVDLLKKWDAWEDIPGSVREYLLNAEPAQETMKADEFYKTRSRIYGLMPDHLGTVPTAAKKAEELGFKPYILYNSVNMKAEASQVGVVTANIALKAAENGDLFKLPAALIGRTEMIVTVGKGKGMGGRNQECALAAAVHIEGSERIVMGSVDTDGTDGPGKQFISREKDSPYADIPVLNGAVVDGTTAKRARKLGFNVFEELKHHNTSPVLYALGDGVISTQNISMNDLTVTLILGET